MPNKGVSMHKVKQILRLKYEAKLSQHQIARSLSISVGVVNKYLQFATTKELSWPLPAELDDEENLRRFLMAEDKQTTKQKPTIDFQLIHQELKRKGVTLQLLWEELRAAQPYLTSYSHFCLLYRKWNKTQPSVMRQNHKAGDKVFIDYAGPKVLVFDPDTYQTRTAEIFVGILGASNYTYAEATWTQQLPDWIGSHVRMLEFFGGVPALIVPDNLRSGVNKACRYEPEINQTYAELIEHYGTAVLPTRPAKPKDKAKVENAVLVVERWILARLRNQKFVGLSDLNESIRTLLNVLNNKPFKKIPGTRASLFAELDKPALRALPKYQYQYADHKQAKVNIDYHIELEHHYYSVPYQLIGKEVTLRYTNKQVGIWYLGKQVALHVRSAKPGAFTTLTEHMPKSHQAHMSWTPGKFLNWASSIGKSTLSMVKHLLENKPHPEQGYRSCLGLLSLSKKFGNERLEKACAYAWQSGAKTRRSVQSILTHNLENTVKNEQTTLSEIIEHENIRGKDYYH